MAKRTRKKAVKRAPVKRKRRKAGKRKVSRKAAPVRRKKRATRKAPAKRRRRKTGKRVIKQVERSSVERTLQGKRRRRSRPRKRRVVMAGTRRRRSVGKSGGKGLLIALGLGAIALLLLSKKSTTYQPGTYNLPPLTQTQNLTRNTQSNDIIQYAIAGGLAIDAIIKLIDRLNTSNDQEVQNIYDHVNTTGDVQVYV